jgi:hypothetical protein
LMFVVVSLGPKVIATPGRNWRARVHPDCRTFTTVLLVAALLTIPSLHPQPLAAILAVGGIGGAISLVSASAPAMAPERTRGRGPACYIGLPILSYLLILRRRANLVGGEIRARYAGGGGDLIPCHRHS